MEARLLASFKRIIDSTCDRFQNCHLDNIRLFCSDSSSAITGVCSSGSGSGNGSGSGSGTTSTTSTSSTTSTRASYRAS